MWVNIQVNKAKYWKIQISKAKSGPKWYIGGKIRVDEP